VLGHSLAGAGDVATVRRIDAKEVTVTAVRGVETRIPLDAARNTAGVALLALIEGLRLEHGFEVELDKGIALGSGMGGSASSCVAALVAANALLDKPLPREALYPYALAGEAIASGGRNGDNVAPMLLGGLVLATPGAHGAHPGALRPGIARWCTRRRCWRRCTHAACCRANGGCRISWRRTAISAWCSPAASAAIRHWCAPACATCWWNHGARR
jgi:hypothetical protein